MSTAEFQRKCENLIRPHIIQNVGELITFLAQVDSDYSDSVRSILVAEDYESPAKHEGYSVEEVEDGWIWRSPEGKNSWAVDAEKEAWQDCCEQNGIEPEENEAYEFWIVSGWLASKLEAKGELISGDIFGMIVWGRCTSGQSIFIDGVIEAIAAEHFAMLGCP